ncbi:putative undecaprenyl-phosphate N-acetylglucosaminyl 1-phosphate transferase [subsurface metagenome]
MLDDLIGPERSLSWVLQFWPVLVFSFISALVATSLCKSIAIKFGIVDKPDNLVKTHKGTVAYLGGVGILAGLTVGVLTGIYCIGDQEHFRLSFTWLVAVLAGGAIACLIGLVDDIFDIKPRQKILGQIVAAVVLVLVGIRPALYYSLAGARIPENVEVILGIPIVIIFVLGASNSLNLLDGLDGLCAGFLPFNRHPAKIFMGDAGSMLLGFVVAALMILFAEKIPRWWMASVVVFGLPILDTGVALVRRFINKRPLFVSDRGHIYDQMIDRGIPLKRTVAICYGLAAVYALVGLAMSQIRTRYALIVYVIVFVVSGIVVWQKGYLKMGNW